MRRLPNSELVEGAAESMAINDPIGDLLTRIRNGQERGLAKITTPASKLRGRVLDVLKAEGFIRGYTEVQEKGKSAQFEVELKYHEGRPVIREAASAMKPALSS